MPGITYMPRYVCIKISKTKISTDETKTFMNVSKKNKKIANLGLICLADAGCRVSHRCRDVCIKFSNKNVNG